MPYKRQGTLDGFFTSKKAKEEPGDSSAASPSTAAPAASAAPASAQQAAPQVAPQQSSPSSLRETPNATYCGPDNSTPVRHVAARGTPYLAVVLELGAGAFAEHATVVMVGAGLRFLAAAVTSPGRRTWRVEPSVGALLAEYAASGADAKIKKMAADLSKFVTPQGKQFLAVLASGNDASSLASFASREADVTAATSNYLLLSPTYAYAGQSVDAQQRRYQHLACRARAVHQLQSKQSLEGHSLLHAAPARYGPDDELAMLSFACARSGGSIAVDLLEAVSCALLASYSLDHAYTTERERHLPPPPQLIGLNATPALEGCHARTAGSAATRLDTIGAVLREMGAHEQSQAVQQQPTLHAQVQAAQAQLARDYDNELAAELLQPAGAALRLTHSRNPDGSQESSGFHIEGLGRITIQRPALARVYAQRLGAVAVQQAIEANGGDPHRAIVNAFLLDESYKPAEDLIHLRLVQGAPAGPLSSFTGVGAEHAAAYPAFHLSISAPGSALRFETLLFSIGDGNRPSLTRFFNMLGGIAATAYDQQVQHGQGAAQENEVVEQHHPQQQHNGGGEAQEQAAQEENSSGEQQQQQQQQSGGGEAQEQGAAQEEQHVGQQQQQQQSGGDQPQLHEHDQDDGQAHNQSASAEPQADGGMQQNTQPHDDAAGVQTTAEHNWRAAAAAALAVTNPDAAALLQGVGAAIPHAASDKNLQIQIQQKLGGKRRIRVSASATFLSSLGLSLTSTSAAPRTTIRAAFPGGDHLLEDFKMPDNRTRFVGIGLEVQTATAQDGIAAWHLLPTPALPSKTQLGNAKIILLEALLAGKEAAVAAGLSFSGPTTTTHELPKLANAKAELPYKFLSFSLDKARDRLGSTYYGANTSCRIYLPFQIRQKLEAARGKDDLKGWVGITVADEDDDVEEPTAANVGVSFNIGVEGADDWHTIYTPGTSPAPDSVIRLAAASLGYEIDKPAWELRVDEKRGVIRKSTRAALLQQRHENTAQELLALASGSGASGSSSAAPGGESDGEDSDDDLSD